MNHLHLHPAQITTDNTLHNHIQPPITSNQPQSTPTTPQLVTFKQ